MKQTYLQPITLIGDVSPGAMLMTEGSPVIYITGVHNPLEWQTGGGNADDGV